MVNYDDLKPRLDAALAARTRGEWIARLKAAGVPCGSVRDLQELFDDPQVAARSMVAEIEHATAGVLKVLGTPIKLSDTPGTIRTPPPVLGQHTESVLVDDLGFTPRASRGAARQRCDLMEISAVRRRPAGNDRSRPAAAGGAARSAADAGGGGIRPRSSIRSRCRCSSRSPSALKASGYPFAVMTPGGSVRLTSEKTADDYIELSLDTAGEEPVVMGHSRHSRGRRVRETERPIGSGPVGALTEEHVLNFLMFELEPFVEK